MQSIVVQETLPRAIHLRRVLDNCWRRAAAVAALQHRGHQLLGGQVASVKVSETAHDGPLQRHTFD